MIVPQSGVNVSDDLRIGGRVVTTRRTGSMHSLNAVLGGPLDS